MKFKTLLPILAVASLPVLALLSQWYIFDKEKVLTKDEVIEQTVVNTFMVSTEAKKEGDTRPILRTLLGHGTGFTYLATETEGIVITNYHVIAKHLSRPELTTLNLYMINRPWAYPAEVIGFDKVTDIAVLRIKKVDNESWLGLDWNLTKNYMEGTPVITVGHGLSLPYTVTEGIISGTDRFRSRKLNFLMQHSAIINVGNSGGPVVGLDGKVLAVNSMIVSPSSTGSGIAAWDGVAMAVSGWQAIYSIEQIIEHGEVKYSKIDFETRSPTIEEVHKQDNECYDGDRTKRSYAYLIVNDDSVEAKKAGLQTDDIMISVEGEPIYGIVSIAKAVIDKKPNTMLTFGFLRDCVYMETEYKTQPFEPFKIITGPTSTPPPLLYSE